MVHLPGVQDELRSVAAGLTLLPLVLLANGPDTEGTATRDLLVVCATVAALALVTAFAPRVWARGAAVLTALGVFLLGFFARRGPLAALAGPEHDGSIAAWSSYLDDARRSCSVDAPLSSRSPWSLPQPACCVTSPRSCAGTRPRWSGRSHLPWSPSAGWSLLLELEPPLWAAVLAAALTTAIAAGATWWSRDETLAAVARQLRHGRT